MQTTANIPLAAGALFYVGIIAGGPARGGRAVVRLSRVAVRVQTRPSASVPAEKSRFFACLLLSLMFRRRSFTESALRSASS